MPAESWSFYRTSAMIDRHIKERGSNLSHKPHSFTGEKELHDAKRAIGSDNLLVLLTPQRGSVLYIMSYDAYLKRILKEYPENGYLIIYPGMA